MKREKRIIPIRKGLKQAKEKKRKEKYKHHSFTNRPRFFLRQNPRWMNSWISSSVCVRLLIALLEEQVGHSLTERRLRLAR